MAEQTYLPLVRQTDDLTVKEIVDQEITWDEVFREAVVILLRSMADAMERYPEYVPPVSDFCVVFKLEQQNWNNRLIAKVEIDD